MRHEPTAAELLYLDDMDHEQRLHYFITRAMESEEIWRLCDSNGWSVRHDGESLIMPLWPYSGLAQPFAGSGETTDAVSLEHFVYHELNDLHASNILMEVLPGKQAGLRISAAKLFHIFDHKLDEEQYFIEG
ncbi:DUF2750 domain-containing protein [Mariprofundus ferrooxydans]|uniref:DUF2750 domain-containing protein n=1 Tax=Mariprofundus ferrooxydans TaxID=314344 RepID=UPI00143203B9|nr:DUF2750 domain-containing protein [Mariprofundus ferrooxydans]